MVSTDPISDMLTRIRNAILVNKTEIELPYSKIKLSIAQLLKKEGFLEDVRKQDSGERKSIVITINNEGSNPAITHIERVSKPGRRLYAPVEKIPRVKQGRGIMVLSTSKGIISDNEARKLRLGGELICKVY
ncbi:30S ribosomal protein S8 [Candidatus Saccharibacteria bacterium CPR2]|nr:30S ribosomal protein S8 [Candidatus Saccharibacteria bacterium CPR2]